MKKMTIIIPCLEEEKLDCTLHSLEKQSYKEIEILIISTKKIEKDDKNYESLNIKWFSNLNLKSKLSMCLYGIEKASGEFVTFLNSGDEVSLDFYRSMVRKADVTKSDIVISNVVEVENTGNKIINNLMTYYQKELNNDDCFESYFKSEGLNYLWTILGNKIFSLKLAKQVQKILSEKKIETNDISLLNYFLFRKCKRLNQIDNDYLFYHPANPFINEQSVFEFTKIFQIIEDDLKRTKLYDTYKNNLLKWKNLYTSYLVENKINYDKFNKNYQEIEKRDYDYYYLIKTNWNNGLETIKEKIMNPDIKMVSFDIFDTLLLRPFLYPTDLFQIVDKYFRQLTHNETATEFFKMRTDSEKLARKQKISENRNSQDITLDEIYETMKKRYRLSEDVISKLKEKELEEELRFCTKRNTAYELYELCKYLGKKVICTSDMYLPKDFICKLLEKNDYIFDQVYVSCEYDITKACGDLYPFVVKDNDLKAEEVLHIGDNIVSDVTNAQKKGLQACHLPKTIDIFFNTGITNCLSAVYQEHLPFWMDNKNAFEFNGIRTCMALVANKYFDNPFRSFHQKSDYNADLYLIGYFCLGMYMFGLTKWILDDVQGKSYDKLVFMARDGFLPIQCYKTMKEYFKEKPKEEYLYISRKALLPIIIQDKMDFYKLPETLNIESISPLELAGYIKQLIRYDEDEIIRVCNENKINPKAHMKSLEQFNRFIDLLIEHFYDKEKKQKNLKILSEYFKNIYGNHGATFDVGYSARPSYFLSKLLGYPIDTYFCNINASMALRHADMGGFQLKTFYPAKPSTVGHACELFLSSLSASCIAYNIENGKVTEVFEDYSVSSTVSYAINTLQSAAFDFVKDMCDTFGEDIHILYLQNYYVGLPFLAYINSSKEIDKYPFESVPFEDDLSFGSIQKMRKVWSDELMQKNQHDINSLVNIKENKEEYKFTGDRLYYNSNVQLQEKSKFMRLLFYLLFDRDTLKRRIREIKHNINNR